MNEDWQDFKKIIPLRDHDEKIRAIFDAIRRLMAPKEAPNKKIGFQLNEKRAS